MSPRRIGRKEPTAVLVRACLRDVVGRVEERTEDLRRGEPDGIHQLRLAVRRLRSLLATFRPVLDEDHAERVRAELSWIGDLLGAARDAEVVLAHLLARLADLPDRRGVDVAARRARLLWSARYDDAHADVLTALGSDRYAALLASLDALVAAPPLRGWADRRIRRVVPALVQRDVDRLCRRMGGLPPPGEADFVDRLHGVRKAAKRVRYSAEAGRPAYGKDAKRLARAMKRFSSRLGDHHDAEMAREAVAELVGRATTPDEAFAWGNVDAVEARGADEIVAEVGLDWSRARSESGLDEWAPR